MSLTVFPVVRVDSNNGSSSPSASGAGPTTALTGTNLATSDGLTPSTITLTSAGDLSGIATDGSALIYLVTGAGRRFSRISAVDNTLKTVTIEDTITTANCTNKSWAIGGTLNALHTSGTWRFLVDNGSSAGDAKAGWIIELKSGHSETTTSSDIWPAGDTTTGRFTIRGAAGAATRPLISTSSANGFYVRGNGNDLNDFDVKQTTSAAVYVVRLIGDNHNCTGLRVYSTGATKATNGIYSAGAGRHAVSSCEIYDCLTGIGTTQSVVALNNYVHDCASYGIDIATTSDASGNVVVDCGTGIRFAGTSIPSIHNNVLDTNTVGIEFNSTMIVAPSVTCGVRNNLIVNSTNYGIHFSNASHTETYSIYYYYPYFLNNFFYNNGSHHRFNTTNSSDVSLWAGYSALTDEPFTIATKAARKTAGDWTVGSACKATGFPTVNVGLLAATRNYMDVGLQLQSTSGGSTPYVIGS